MSNSNNRNKWDDRFMARAFQVASWSKDPAKQVGAVVVVGNRVIAEGYNGYPPGIADTNLEDREYKLARVIHAEDNALWWADRRDLIGATMYVTHAPCSHCAAKIVRAQLKRVVFPHPSPGSNWERSIGVGAQLLIEARIERSIWHPPRFADWHPGERGADPGAQPGAQYEYVE